jgi:uncharacterized OB-fold protein
MPHAIGCPSCGHLVLKRALQCQACGHRLADGSPVERSGAGTLLAMLAALLAIAMVLALVAWAIPPINEAIGEVVKKLLRLR